MAGNFRRERIAAQRLADGLSGAAMNGRSQQFISGDATARDAAQCGIDALLEAGGWSLNVDAHGFFFREDRYSTRFTRSSLLMTVCKLGIMRETGIFVRLVIAVLAHF